MKTGKSIPGSEATAARLQKVMAAAGLGSRRTLETQISQGAVLINGKKAVLGNSVRCGDRISYLDHQWRVQNAAAEHRTLIYNKPEGELTTRADPQGRPTVFDRLPRLKGARWIAVGRLDINTTGLLLLTTDGELAHAMMHPSRRVDREYVCRIRGQVSSEQVEKLRQGIVLDDGPARFSDIQKLEGGNSNQWFKVTILEGRNREVRRLWEAVGCTVSRLKRVRYGGAKLPGRLRVGTWSEISPQEQQILRQDVNLAASSGQLTLKDLAANTRARQKPNSRKAARPPAPGDKRAISKPGSPAGAGRRPHPRSRKSGRR